MINKYFPKRKEDIEKVYSDKENITQQMQTLDEENYGDEDLFEDVRNDAGKITKGKIVARLKEIKGNPDFLDELESLKLYLNLMKKEAEMEKKIKNKETDLDEKLLRKYVNLSEDETRLLIIEDKWIKSISDFVRSETKRISQKLTRRITELADRYGTPLPKLKNEVEGLSKKVGIHLRKMGFEW